MDFRKAGFYFVIIISTLIVLASVLSLIYDLPYWYSKLLDFPRLQYLIAGLICLPLFLLLNKKWKWPSILLTLGLVSSIFIHSVRIVPYWFGTKTVADAPVNISEDNAVSVLLANVLISNRDSGKLLTVIREANPDIIIAMEVNEWWLKELTSIQNDYPYTVEQPNEVAYGMALYSKYPLNGTEIKYIKHKNVPSIHTGVQLKSGKEFMLYAVHPVAPMPGDEYPDNVGEAEIELVRVADLVSRNNMPSMVAGDFNDVSWSNTSRLFEHDGQLNNVRLGRGLYNTFDANSFFMRWPLDHYFVTEEFRLVDLKRLDKIGSDHFPIIAKFSLE